MERLNLDINGRSAAQALGAPAGNRVVLKELNCNEDKALTPHSAKTSNSKLSATPKTPTPTKMPSTELVFAESSLIETSPPNFDQFEIDPLSVTGLMAANDLSLQPNSDLNEITNQFLGYTQLDKTALPELPGGLDTNFDDGLQPNKICFEEALTPTLTANMITSTGNDTPQKGDITCSPADPIVLSDEETFSDCQSFTPKKDTKELSSDIEVPSNSSQTPAKQTENINFKADNTVENHEIIVRDLTREEFNAQLDCEPMDVDTSYIYGNDSNEVPDNIIVKEYNLGGMSVSQVIDVGNNFIYAIPENKIVQEERYYEPVASTTHKANNLVQPTTEEIVQLQTRKAEKLADEFKPQQTQKEISLNESVKLSTDQTSTDNALDTLSFVSANNITGTVNVSPETSMINAGKTNENVNLTLDMTTSYGSNSTKGSAPSSPTFPVKPSVDVKAFPRSPKKSVVKEPQFLEKSEYAEKLNSSVKQPIVAIKITPTSPEQAESTDNLSKPKESSSPLPSTEDADNPNSTFESSSSDKLNATSVLESVTNRAVTEIPKLESPMLALSAISHNISETKNGEEEIGSPAEAGHTSTVTLSDKRRTFILASPVKVCDTTFDTNLEGTSKDVSSDAASESINEGANHMETSADKAEKRRTFNVDLETSADSTIERTTNTVEEKRYTFNVNAESVVESAILKSADQEEEIFLNIGNSSESAVNNTTHFEEEKHRTFNVNASLIDAAAVPRLSPPLPTFQHRSTDKFALEFSSSNDALKLPEPPMPGLLNFEDDDVFKMPPPARSPPIPTMMKRRAIHAASGGFSGHTATELSAKEQKQNDLRNEKEDLSPLGAWKPPRDNGLGRGDAEWKETTQQSVSDEEFGNGVILNPSDFEYLLSKGNDNVKIDRSSLLLKFDPLFGYAVPLKPTLKQLQQLGHNGSSTPSSPLEEEEERRSPHEGKPTEKKSLLKKCAFSDTNQKYKTQLHQTAQPEKNARMSADVITDLKLDNDCNKAFENSNSQADEKRSNYRMDELEKKIKNEVLKTEDIEKKLKESELREEALIKRISEKDKVISKMNGVMEAYEKTIAEMIAEKEQLVQKYEQELMEVKTDRDSNYRHLTSLEMTFSDLHVKYEKSKEMTLQLKANEESLISERRQHLENMKLQEQRYDKMKNHAMQQLEIANKKLESQTKEHAIESTKLKALLKKEEISRASTNEQLQQKARENEELMKICDELINGQGS